MTTDGLPPIGYRARPDRVRHEMERSGVSALAVLDPVGIRWSTGFGGSNAAVAVTPDRLVLVTDGRYQERARDEVEAAGVGAEVLVGSTAAEQHDLLVTALGARSPVAADPGRVSHGRWLELAAHVDLRPGTGIIERCRRVKDAGEIARIERACRAADLALAEVAPMLADGPTERDVRRELEYRMRLYGADGPSYDTIVASGPAHAARPHHGADARAVRDGDTVVIDVGALVDGYHSDMTRSFVVGEPTREQRELYDLVLAVQEAGLGAVTSGVPAREVDRVCRSMVTEAGYAAWYLHSTGHGVGLEIHEEPFEGPTSTEDLVAGDVVTVEPGLYRVGFGGFRVEDLVEVTEHGCRILTASPKESPCLPSPPTT